MSEEKEYNKLVPELRFPEFEKDEEWDVRELGNSEVAEFVDEKTPKIELELKTYISTENLLAEYGGVKQSSKLPESGSFTKYKKGDVLVANIRPYLRKVWFAQKSGAASNDVIVIRASSVIRDYYLQYILKNDSFIDYVMKGAKGLKMPRGDKSLMKKYLVSFPTKFEQQKIADCLYSLDHLIGAETQKLSNLIDHKKGLVQQLFPAKDETVPQLRFPDFEKDGEWGNTQLDFLCDRISSGKDINDPSGKYELYGSTGIIGNSTIATFKGNYVLVARVGANAGLLTKASGLFGVTDNTLIVDIKEGENLNYIYYWLLNYGLSRLVFGSGQPLVTGKQLKQLNIQLSKPLEQQKIANCLGSIDDLIAAQHKRIEALQDHKKGLMQQLFPNINEQQ